MVGIPGKSKACKDCKRRRVKCDLTLPQCLRCAKAGLTCQGYEQATLWVNRTPDHPGITALSVVADARLRHGQQQSSCSRYIEVLYQLRQQLSQPLYDVRQFRLRALYVLQGIYLPQPHVTAGDDDSDLSPSDWIKAVCQMQGPSRGLDYALLAFCTVQVRLFGESDISPDETVRVYNDALGKVIADLDSCQTRNSDETLAAIVALSTCELFVFPTDTSWSAHAHGISELLRHRGVPEQPTASWRSLCLRLCVICVIQALGQRRSLRLKPDQWRYLIGPPSDTESFVPLMDIIVDVPSMLQDAYILLESSDNALAASHYSTLLAQKSQELEAWRRLHQRGAAPGYEPLYWSVLSRLDNPADFCYADKLFPFALAFSSMGKAVTWIFCSTVMLQILDAALLLDALTTKTTTLSSSISSSSSSSSSSSPLPDDKPMQAEADKLARMLCQSIEFCYRAENGTFGPQVTCSTQWTLRRYFRRRGLARELDWCRGIKDMKGKEDPASRCRIDLMEFGPQFE